MKKKKLIATVAAFCLIFVAVVAAVVGVVAATKQKANTKLSVRYIARNVNGTVSMSSRVGGFQYRPDANNAITKYNDYASNFSTPAINDGTNNLDSKDGYRFYPMDYTKDQQLDNLEEVTPDDPETTNVDETELQTIVAELGWSDQLSGGYNVDGEETFATYAIYQFKFTNEGKQDYIITAKYNDTNAADVNNPINFELYWLKGTNANPTITTNYTNEGVLDYNGANGEFVLSGSNIAQIIDVEDDQETTDVDETVTDLADLYGQDGLEIATVAKKTGNDATVYYVYLVVVIKDVESNINTFSIGGNSGRSLTFELVAQPNANASYTGND